MEATPSKPNHRCVRWLIPWLCLTFAIETSAEDTAAPTLEELKKAGAARSSYRTHQRPAITAKSPQANLPAYRRHVEPALQQFCVRCHGPETQEGNVRIDTLDPDLLHGEDVNWWLEILAVLSNGEMPPADEPALSDDDLSRVVEWVSSELAEASEVRRAQQEHSSFRRMTRYEYDYALQDLLGLPFHFAKDLPPEATSDEGFQNSSELLHLSAIQLAAYRELSRKALHRATVSGERPQPLHWGVSMEDASAAEWAKQDEQLERFKREHQDDPEELAQQLARKMAGFRGPHGSAYYKQLTTGRTAAASWNYRKAEQARKPATDRSPVPEDFDHVAIIPPNQKLIVELGDQIPEKGTLRVRVRASRTSTEHDRVPSLQLQFGWQASNDSQATVRISDRDIPIDSAADNPKFYQWDIPLSEIYPRNLVRKTSQLGDLPSPSEYVRLVNSTVSGGDIQLDYVEITAPVYDQWPPASHRRIFFDSENQADETAYAKEVLTSFMSKAWRRRVSEKEVEQKLALWARVRPDCVDFQQAMIEVLATILASPKFLYLVQSNPEHPSRSLSPEELATRLSMFLWCSTPDEQLLALAAENQIHDRQQLTAQVNRMLNDVKSQRFSKHFVRQWLGMQLLDYLKVDLEIYPHFDTSLKEAMQEEPVAFFREVLQNNDSVLDFLHADYTVANERLARHYGVSNVYGNDFRRIQFSLRQPRGGLMTQAGLLAMNSDGTDSHPLKRGIWMLENLLDDPPPPPPPAVPEIDLADPEIAKLTLKQRIENHRDHAACKSCHAKIDPWGIALENFDAVGSWRTEVQGKPVDASSQLFNNQRLDGIDGLKRFLLEKRQDQFVRAMVHKMATYALGRPLSFGDRASIDQITADVRRQGDGLATMVTQIVTSDLFQSK